jgi:hypothetical protein
MVLVMFLLLFIVPGVSFHIHPAVSFDIVGTAGVDHDMDPWWCRQEAVNVDAHIGSRQTGKAGRSGKSCLGLIETQGEGYCSQYQQGKNRFSRHYFSFFNSQIFSVRELSISAQKIGRRTAGIA